jgi:hypothetical protein
MLLQQSYPIFKLNMEEHDKEHEPLGSLLLQQSYPLFEQNMRQQDKEQEIQTPHSTMYNAAVSVKHHTHPVIQQFLFKQTPLDAAFLQKPHHMMQRLPERHHTS